MTEGPTEQYVLLGEPLSLVCGTGLDSNPQASVTWIAPGETTAIVDNDRYDLENGPEIVRLNFTNTIMGDNRLWKCVVTVTSGRYIVSSGNLVSQDQANIGSVTRDIQLTVIGELQFCEECSPLIHRVYQPSKFSICISFDVGIGSLKLM